MDANAYALISQVVSSRRLESYRQPGDTDADVLARYAWNTRLCEAFYPALQNLEVAFRNSLHAAACQSFGDRRWLRASNPLFELREQKTLRELELKLTAQGRRLEPDGVVAQTTFGFWTSLIDVRYEQVLWPRLLKSTFPHIHPRLRTRAVVSKRFNEIRKLRNSIFHHEAVWNRGDLGGQHARITEAIGWISPTLRTVSDAVDGFSHICTMAYREQLKSRLEQALSS